MEHNTGGEYTDGKEKIGPIEVNKGILQGDSFCVSLFTLALNPIARLRGS